MYYKIKAQQIMFKTSVILFSKLDDAYLLKYNSLLERYDFDSICFYMSGWYVKTKNNCFFLMPHNTSYEKLEYFTKKIYQTNLMVKKYKLDFLQIDLDANDLSWRLNSETHEYILQKRLKDNMNYIFLIEKSAEGILRKLNYSINDKKIKSDS